MRIAFLDCFSGISGDMSLAALVDAGADRNYIEEELRKIRIEPFSLEWKRVNKKGISALKMDVILDPDSPPTHHRHYSEIVTIITGSGFNDRVVALSLAIFEKIAMAEAKIHNIPIETVHFHEVGAIDSIVDVIGVALALDSLEIEKIWSSPVPLGSGVVHCDHGIYPVPAPATLEMMRGLPIAPTAYSLEMTTPTGAAIIAGVVDEFSKGFPSMIVETIGYGAGTRDLPNQPNVLRAVIGKADPFLPKYQVQHSEIATHGHAPEHEHHHKEHRHGHTHEHDHQHKEHLHGHTHEHDHQHKEHLHGHTHEHDHQHKEHLHGHTHEHDHQHKEHLHGHTHEYDHQHSFGHSHDHQGNIDHRFDFSHGPEPTRNHTHEQERDYYQMNSLRQERLSRVEQPHSHSHTHSRETKDMRKTHHEHDSAIHQHGSDTPPNFKQ